VNLSGYKTEKEDNDISRKITEHLKGTEVLKEFRASFIVSVSSPTNSNEPP
jgi:hypothetical protein